MLNLRSAADATDARSFSNRMRSKRFAIFERLAAGRPGPLRIIDIGGTSTFWEHRGWAEREWVQITTVNLFAEPRKHPNILPMKGDATNLKEHGDKSFDIAFSNSVIEHLFTLDAQRAMAREVRRVAKAYWVQTPNYWFPMEPHFHVPGWQWMPKSVRVAMIRRWRCGWRGPCPDPVAARLLVEEVRLLSRRELRELFPEATLWSERFIGFTKSFVAMHGFSEDRGA